MFWKCAFGYDSVWSSWGNKTWSMIKQQVRIFFSPQFHQFWLTLTWLSSQLIGWKVEFFHHSVISFVSPWRDLLHDWLGGKQCFNVVRKYNMWGTITLLSLLLTLSESICGHEGFLLMWEFRARYLWRDQSMIIDIGALAAKPAATVYSPIYRRFLLSSSFYLVHDQTSLNTEILKTVSIHLVHHPSEGRPGISGSLCLKSQGCHSIPLSYLLSSFSAQSSCSFYLVILLLSNGSFSWLFPENSPTLFIKK